MKVDGGFEKWKLKVASNVESYYFFYYCIVVTWIYTRKIFRDAAWISSFGESVTKPFCIVTVKRSTCQSGKSAFASSILVEKYTRLPIQAFYIIRLPSPRSKIFHRFIVIFNIFRRDLTDSFVINSRSIRSFVFHHSLFLFVRRLLIIVARFYSSLFHSRQKLWVS